MQSNIRKIALDSCVARPKDLPTAEISGEIVMMNLEKGKYFALDSVGSRIWELLEPPKTVRDIIRNLLEEYEVDARVCEEQVLEFMGKLYGEGLLELVEDK